MKLAKKNPLEGASDSRFPVTMRVANLLHCNLSGCDDDDDDNDDDFGFTYRPIVICVQSRDRQ